MNATIDIAVSLILTCCFDLFHYFTLYSYNEIWSYLFI